METLTGSLVWNTEAQLGAVGAIIIIVFWFVRTILQREKASMEFLHNTVEETLKTQREQSRDWRAMVERSIVVSERIEQNLKVIQDETQKNGDEHRAAFRELREQATEQASGNNRQHEMIIDLMQSLAGKA